MISLGKGVNMATMVLNLRGLKCPQPTLQMTIKLRTELKDGDILEVVADCPTFVNDLKGWGERMKKAVLWIKDEDNGAKRCQVKI
ncbi:SirA-like domain-containing protein [Candidatus Magnetobacterium bavaricum]|uniref:SirA-like domain-containing protein n=1 Tax=Candidatus Magnetobacterium bavaricum TaxID=29290 RepID=A0A0F3GSA5_9BACT|nr:SirA-like domain-containing protein [Candidatus Magnetobacterium bavaricum]